MRLGVFMVSHPVMSLVITIALLASITRSASLLRETATVKAPSWLVVALLLWIILAASAVLVIFPRALRAAPDEAKVAVRWAGAVGIYLVGWVAWVLFGAATWIFVLAATTTLVLLLVVVWSIPSPNSS